MKDGSGKADPLSMRAMTRRLLLIAQLALAGCIGSGNHGWDYGSEPDPAGGPSIQQAWRGVHEGRIGFRCREGRVLLFVETWHPLDVPPGQRLLMQLGYRFEAAGPSGDSVTGLATRRGIEIPAARIGEGAPNPLLRRLADADELFVSLDGAGHLISIRFDIEDAQHAFAHAQGGCGTAPREQEPVTR